MANLETGKVAPTYSVILPALVTGSGSTVAAGLTGLSNITSIVRYAVGGTPGVPYAVLTEPSAGSSGWLITVHSSSATDTSQYQVFYTNEYVPSPAYPQGTASTLTAGYQYAP